MANISKRIRAIREAIVPGKQYVFAEAVQLLKSMPKVKFDESVDVAVNLGVDARKSDQVVRGAKVLPFGTGKTVRIAVFAQGEKQNEAQSAGADIVGFEDLAESIKAGRIEFDILIATPDAMRVVGQLGQILGPRGLMPNPKVGTVTNEVGVAVQNAKAGQVRFRTDKGGIIHSTLGKLSFGEDAIRGNLMALLQELRRLKPATSKGIYFKKVTLSSTMGPGLQLDQGVLSDL